jgi:outer membrane protein, multidrug efflux system
MKRIFLAAAFAAAGCTTVGPDYARPRIGLPNDYSLNENKAEPDIPGEWWKLYGDPKLEALVAATLANNADLRLAAARVEEAEGALREAGAAFFPEVTGGYSYARNRVSTLTLPPQPVNVPLTRPQNQLLASTSFELDFWGRFSRASEAARAALLSSRYARDVVGLTLASATAQTYFGTRSLDAQLGVLAQTIRTRSDSLDLARARLAAGLVSELDVHQAQGALSDALVQRRDTERQRALLERQLGQLSGQLDLRLAPGDLFALPVPPTPPAGLPSALLDRRPDIRAAEESLVASNAQIGVARAAMFPAISLTGALGAQSAAFSSLLSSGAGIWSLGYALALPIFDAGRREARVEQAEARSRQSLASYQKAIETAFREVSEGLINVEQSGATEADLALRLQAARNALELSNLRYEAGYSPFLEVLDAQRTANEAELAFVRNRQERLAVSVDLMKALGGGWVDREPRVPARPAPT